MKAKVWNIDWNVSDEDYKENLGGLEDDNGLPYSPKDLGLPARDSEIILEIEPEGDDEEDYMNAIDNALADEYGFTAWVWDYEIVEPEDSNDDTVLRYMSHCSGDDPEAHVEV